MTTPDHVLDVFRSQLGVKESPPNSNRQRYGEWYGLNGSPWCAMFVSWCFDQAGMTLRNITTAKGFAYCPYGVSWFRSRGQWSSTPQPGAVAFYGYNGLSVHVGVVESFTDTTITTIEGNTGVGRDVDGGAVMRRVRARNGWIVGYGLPAYVAEGSSPQATPASHQEIDMSDFDPMRVITYPDGTKTGVEENGNIYNAGTQYFGSLADLPVDRKIGVDKIRALTAVDPTDSSKGYRMHDQLGRKYTFDQRLWADIQKLK